MTTCERNMRNAVPMIMTMEGKRQIDTKQGNLL